MSITVKDLINHLQRIDPDTPVFKRASGTGSAIYDMTEEDYSASFFECFIDPTAQKNGKYEFDFMSGMEAKQGSEITNKNAIKALAL